MKPRLLLAALLLVVLAGVGFPLLAQVVTTIPNMQQVPIDSLRKLDTLQAATAGKYLDKSPNWHGSDTNADTVTITGVVVVKPGVLTYTLARYNIFIQDTTTGQLWGGLNVLTNDTSSQAQSTGVTALDTGMVVKMTGRITEYGSQNNSLTEMFIYDVGFYVGQPTGIVPINVVGQIPRPQPKLITLDSLVHGTTPMPSRGEKYECMYVIIKNVTVIQAFTDGHFIFADSAGNQGYMYDGSGYFTFRGHAIKGAGYKQPPTGTLLNYIRGVVIPQSRAGTCGDYNIMPLYPGDISVNKFGPQLTNLFRTPSPPATGQAVTVTYKAKNLNVGGVVDSSFFYYQLGTKTPWVSTKVAPITGGGDSLYSVTIPAVNGDSLVSFYAKAYGGGVFSTLPDPTNPWFYQVRAAGFSIKDIEYTPYSNGQSGFVGDTVTVSGIIIADTTDIKEITSNRPRLWMESAAGPWNGIPIWGTTVGLGVDTLKRGDSVQVRGVVSNLNSRTNIQVTSWSLKQRGVAVPAPTVLPMSSSPYYDYLLSNMPQVGNPQWAQWVGSLVQFTNVYLTQLNADNPLGTSSSNFGEYFLGASPPPVSYGIRVDDNGTHSYYADTSAGYLTTGSSAYPTSHPYSPPKTQLIKVGQKISFIVGILDMSFSEYKLEPRKNSDFGAITEVFQVAGIQPNAYQLEQNYPNPFNPTTTIRYSVPTAGNVTLKIYNILGQEVQTLVDHQQNAGKYVVVFDATRLATGVYFYQLKSENFTSVKKMLLLK
jgi:hypothetical protein